MEVIITMLFILALFVADVSILQASMSIKDEEKARFLFMLLAAFNILATTGVLLALYPHMASEPQLLALAGFFGGAAVMGLSTLPFKGK